MFGFRRQPAPSVTDSAGAAQWRERGNQALSEGRLDDAAACYRQAAGADASDPLARVNLGYVLLERGDAGQAAQLLLEALALAAGRADVTADAQFLLGQAHEKMGQIAQAVLSFRAALAARPVFAPAAQELVRLLIATGLADEAASIAQRNADSARTPAALMLLAQALHAAGHAGQALGALEAILAAEPGHPGALESRGTLLLELGRDQEALTTFERLLAAHGRKPDALANASAALLKLVRPSEALALVDEALRIQPQHRASLHNKARALLDLLRVDEALQLSLQATRLFPQDADLRWNLAVAQLLAGHWSEGWKNYEARWQASGPGRPRAPTLPARRWTGAESLQGQSILLHAEQGLGDSIQFLRYVAQVAALAREVVLQVQAALVPLAADAAGNNCRVVAVGEPLPETQWECPLLSLPAAFGTSLSTVPSVVPYLRADAARVQAWQRRLSPDDPRLRVGITWSGNPLHQNDRNRSVPLALLRDIASPAFTFVSLQPQVRESDRSGFAAWDGLVDAGPDLRSFADTAALMQTLDLVLTVDTSVAHLAGALGRPVWILLPFAPDWRWLLERRDSPWYPTARLYRQPAIGAWAPVLERVREDLHALAGEPISRTIPA